MTKTKKLILVLLVLFFVIGLGVLIIETLPPIGHLKGADPTADWKTYQNNNLGLSFKYPKDWTIDDKEVNQVRGKIYMKDSEGEDVHSGMEIINKSDLESNGSTYLEMFASNSRCPAKAGQINYLGETEAVTYFYCLTGTEIKINDGVWKQVLNCPPGFLDQASSCSYEFWMDANNYFYVVKLGYYYKPQDVSINMEIISQILSTFKFTK